MHISMPILCVVHRRQLAAGSPPRSTGGARSLAFLVRRPSYPNGDLGNVLYALLVGVSIFFCEPELVRMLTEPDD